jgi:hypothetical protein
MFPEKLQPNEICQKKGKECRSSESKSLVMIFWGIAGIRQYKFLAKARIKE